MANNLTNWGEEVMLVGNGAGDGSIARQATSVRLYTSASVPNKDGTGFTEVANGNGYTTGGVAIALGNWTLSLAGSVNQIALTLDPSWTASGGSILNIAGAYIADGTPDVMAWWERTPLTLLDTETLTLDDLTIRL